MNIAVGIFGSQSLVEEALKKLGKIGTANDIEIYNHASSEGVFTYVAPHSDKVQSLLQALSMIDFPVFLVDELSKEVGEQIVALDEINFEKGFLYSGVDISKVIAQTCLEKFEQVTMDNLREKIMSITVEKSASPIRVPIDNYFNVKSVGTVVLGIVKSGTLNKFDKLIIEPLGKEVLVKSIQSQDKNIDTAPPGTRVGLNIKGIEADELRRGYVLCDSMKKSSELSVTFVKSKFFKDELKPGMQIFITAGLFVAPGKIDKIDGSHVTVKAEYDMPFDSGQRIIIASTTAKLPRIIGHGSVA